MEYGKKVKNILEKEKFHLSKSRTKLTSGKALRIYRELQKLTQAETDEINGLKQATISALEHDHITLGLERAKVLAKALKIHPSVLAFPDWEPDQESDSQRLAA